MNYYITIVKGIIDGTEAREVVKATDLIMAKGIAWKRVGSACEDANCTFAFATVCNKLGQMVVPAVSFERPTEEPTEEVASEA